METTNCINYSEKREIEPQQKTDFRLMNVMKMEKNAWMDILLSDEKLYPKILLKKISLPHYQN